MAPSPIVRENAAVPEIAPDLGQFDLSGRAAVVTGATGALGRAIALGLARCGSKVAVLARSSDATEKVAEQIRGFGGDSIALACDVLERDRLMEARSRVEETWGRLDVLVNAAGGNLASATLAPGETLWDIDLDAFRAVVDLNLLGTLTPIQVFASTMAEARRGSIVNISSATASRPLSRVPGYGAAKAALENLTRWLADHVARRFGPGIRVNAIVPGFFVAEQNRGLLVEPDGSLSERGRNVVAHTPMGRLGEPHDVVGPVVWLASDASLFVTGAVVPVDGGFAAFGGV